MSIETIKTRERPDLQGPIKDLPVYEEVAEVGQSQGPSRFFHKTDNGLKQLMGYLVARTCVNLVKSIGCKSYSQASRARGKLANGDICAISLAGVIPRINEAPLFFVDQNANVLLPIDKGVVSIAQLWNADIDTSGMLQLNERDIAQVWILAAAFKMPITEHDLQFQFTDIDKPIFTRTGQRGLYYSTNEKISADVVQNSLGSLTLCITKEEFLTTISCDTAQLVSEHVSYGYLANNYALLLKLGFTGKLDRVRAPNMLGLLGVFLSNEHATAAISSKLVLYVAEELKTAHMHLATKDRVMLTRELRGLGNITSNKLLDIKCMIDYMTDWSNVYKSLYYDRKRGVQKKYGLAHFIVGHNTLQTILSLLRVTQNCKIVTQAIQKGVRHIKIGLLLCLLDPLVASAPDFVTELHSDSIPLGVDSSVICDTLKALGINTDCKSGAEVIEALKTTNFALQQERDIYHESLPSNVLDYIDKAASSDQTLAADKAQEHQPGESRHQTGKTTKKRAHVQTESAAGGHLGQVLTADETQEPECKQLKKDSISTADQEHCALEPAAQDTTAQLATTSTATTATTDLSTQILDAVTLAIAERFAQLTDIIIPGLVSSELGRQLQQLAIISYLPQDNISTEIATGDSPAHQSAAISNIAAEHQPIFQAFQSASLEQIQPQNLPAQQLQYSNVQAAQTGTQQHTPNQESSGAVQTSMQEEDTRLFDDAYTPAYGLPEVASDIYSGDALEELCAPGNNIAMLSPLQWGDPSYAHTQQHTLQQLTPQPPQQPSCELDQYTAVDACGVHDIHNQH